MSRVRLPTSLGARLSLAAAVAVAVAVALGCMTSYFAVRAKLRDQVDQQLESRSGVAQKAGNLLLRVQPGALGGLIPQPAFGGPSFYGQVISSEGELAGQSALAPPLPVTAPARAVAAGEGKPFLADQHVQGLHLRVLTEPVAPGYAAESDRGSRQKAGRTARAAEPATGAADRADDRGLDQALG